MPTPLIVPTNVSGGGIALPRYRELLADELGFLQTTTVTTAATSGEARRVVLADELRDDEAGYGLLGTWLYVRTGVLAGTQRRILNDSEAGYQGTSSAVVLSRPLDAPLAVGTVVDITGPLPIKRHLGVKGLNDCVTEGLARCPAQAILTLELTGGSSNRLSLDDYPWLTHVDQILTISEYYGVVGANTAHPTTLPYSIATNGVSRELVLGRQYSADETVEIQATLSGDRLIYDGTTWDYRTENPGLHDDNDRAVIPEHWATTFGMSRALRFLYRWVRDNRQMNRDEKRDMLADLMIERQKWASACMVLRDQEFPRARATSGRPLIHGTVSGHGDGYPIESGASWGWSW
jgi:hypothetical protein